MKHALNCSFISMHCIFCCISRFAFFLFLCSREPSVNGQERPWKPINSWNYVYIQGLPALKRKRLPPFLFQKWNNLEMNNQWAKFEGKSMSSSFTKESSYLNCARKFISAIKPIRNTTRIPVEQLRHQHVNFSLGPVLHTLTHHCLVYWDSMTLMDLIWTGNIPETVVTLHQRTNSASLYCAKSYWTLSRENQRRAGSRGSYWQQQWPQV